jgi:hypothetical protein
MLQDVAFVCFEFESLAGEVLSKTAKKKNIRLVGVPAENRARHLLNAAEAISLVSYCAPLIWS